MSPPAQPPSRPQPPWAKLQDPDILALRFRDLKLSLPHSPVAPHINQLYRELENNNLNFRPRCWLSTEWFSPDHVPGIAVPFYLAHPRLARIEKKLMFQVEGGSRDQCLRILRHEAGHAFDTAYQLRRRKRYRQLFGRFASPYPDTYKPDPTSRHHVLNLNGWYAQAHPAEDFAETFAVWLRPNRPGWRSQYKGWPALKKLEYVDSLMHEIRDKKPTVTSNESTDSLPKIRKTLRDHYHEKRMRYADEWPDFYDHELHKLFSSDPRFAARPTAAAFLKDIRRDLRQTVSDWTGVHPYTIDQVLTDMIDRSKELKLRLARPLTQARNDANLMVTVQTMNFLHKGRHRIAI